MRLGKWSDPRRNALATGILFLLPEIIDLCAVRHDLGDCQLKKCPTGVRSPKTIFVSPLMHQFKDSFFILPTLSARVC